MEIFAGGHSNLSQSTPLLLQEQKFAPNHNHSPGRRKPTCPRCGERPKAPTLQLCTLCQSEKNHEMYENRKRRKLLTDQSVDANL